MPEVYEGFYTPTFWCAGLQEFAKQEVGCSPEPTSNHS